MRALSIILSSSFLLIFCSCNKSITYAEQEIIPEYVEIHTKKDIIAFSDTSTTIVPFIYTKVISLDFLPVAEKKQKFAEMLLPSILKIQFQLNEKIRRIEHIENWLLKYDELNNKDSAFLYQLYDTYKCNQIAELKRRVQPHPASIVLGQAAIESGWGSSRFFEEANNVFGIWSYNKKENRIVALRKRDSTEIYVRKYDNIEESVVNYYRTIARTNAYKEFREERQKTKDPYQLIPFLHRYSELGELYTNNLKTLIRINDLTRYDNYSIQKKYQKEEIFELAKVPRFQL